MENVLPTLKGKLYHFFTDESEPIPNPNIDHYPQIGELYFSIVGIINILNKIHISKSAGPDNVPNFIMKLGSSVIAPVLQYYKSLSHRALQIKFFLLIGFLLILCQYLKKVLET